MKSKLYFILNISLGLMLLLSAFIYAGNAQSNKTTERIPHAVKWETEEDKQDEQEVILTIWSPKSMLDYEIESFQEANPHIRVQFTSFQEEPRLAERYLNALAEGSAPDIMVLPQAMLGSFNSVDLIADLSQSHLDLTRYRESMGEYLWEIHQSLDGKRTIALPFEAFPFVLYYREDILKEKGYPVEPEQLAEFLREPDHLLKLAADLKQNNQWLFQWDSDLMTIVNNGQFLFDRDIEYQRESELYKHVIDTTLSFKDYAANISIWSPNGQEMLRNDQLVTVLMPSYGEELIADWAPNQAGKWRVTHLPLGMDAVDLHSSVSLAVSEHSKHKAEAEKFLEYVMNISTVFNWYESSPANSFLGEQNSGDLYLDVLRGNSSNAIPTPLDTRLFDVWYTSVEQSRRSQYSARDTLHAATLDIMDITSVAQEQLRQYLQRSPQ